MALSRLYSLLFLSSLVKWEMLPKVIYQSSPSIIQRHLTITIRFAVRQHKKSSTWLPIQRFNDLDPQAKISGTTENPSPQLCE